MDYYYEPYELEDKIEREMRARERREALDDAAIDAYQQGDFDY